MNQLKLPNRSSTKHWNFTPREMYDELNKLTPIACKHCSHEIMPLETWYALIEMFAEYVVVCKYLDERDGI